MSYYLVASTVDISTLTNVSITQVDMKGALTNLINGQTLVIQSWGSKGEDIFVKLGDDGLTKVSFSDPANVGSGFSSYPVPVNAFTLYDTFIYDESVYKYGTFLKKGQVVKYKNASNVIDSGIVTGTYITAGTEDNKSLYYTLSGDSTLYQLYQSEALDGATGSSDVTIPVLDDMADSHKVSVGTDIKVYVLL